MSLRVEPLGASKSIRFKLANDHFLITKIYKNR